MEGVPSGYDPSVTNLRQPDTPVEMKVFQGGGLSEGQLGGGSQDSMLPQPETPVPMKVFTGGGHSQGDSPVQIGGSKEWMTAFDGAYDFFDTSDYFKNVKLRSVNTQPPKKAAALYILAKDTGRVMLYKRAQEKTIGGPGGEVDAGEPVWLTALREASEEVGFLPRFNIQDTYWAWFTSHLLPNGLIDTSKPRVTDPLIIQAATLLNSIKDRLIPIYASNNIVAYLYLVENENEEVKAQVGEVDTSYTWSDFQTVGKDIGTVREGIAYVGFPDILQHIKVNYSSLSKTSEQKQLVVLKCLMILNAIREATDKDSLSKTLLRIATTQSLSELVNSIPGPTQQTPQQPQQPQQPQTPTAPSDLASKLSGLTFRGVKYTDLAKDPLFASFQPVVIPTPAFTEKWLTGPLEVVVEGVKTVVAPLSAGLTDLYLFHPLGGECTPDRLQTAWGDASTPFIVLFGTPLLKPSTSIFSNTGAQGQAATTTPKQTAAQKQYVVDTKTPTVTLSNGITVRYMEIGDPLKQDIQDLKFTSDEDYLFTHVLKFRKPWVLQWIQQPGNKEEFYQFWKIYVNKDGTNKLLLATSREMNFISQMLRKLIQEYRKALHSATWDWLQSRYPDNYEEFAEDYDAGFFFTTPKAGLPARVAPSATAAGATPSAGATPAATPSVAQPGGSPPTAPPTVPPAGTTRRDVPTRKAALASLAKLKQITRENIGDSSEAEGEEDTTDPDYNPDENSNSESEDGEEPKTKPTKELTPDQENTLYWSTLVDLVNRVLDKQEFDSIEKVDAILSIFVPSDPQLKEDVKLFIHTFIPTEAGGPIDAAQWKPSKSPYYGSDVGSILNDLISLDPKTVKDPKKLEEFRRIFDSIKAAGKRAQAAYARRQAALQGKPGSGTRPPRGKGTPVTAPQQPQATATVPLPTFGTAQPQQQPQATAAAAPGTAPAGPVPAKKAVATGRQTRATSPPPAVPGVGFSPGTPLPGPTTRTRAAQQAPAAAGTSPEEEVGGKRKRTQGGGGRRSSKGRKTRRKSHITKLTVSSGSSQARTSRKARSR